MEKAKRKQELEAPEAPETAIFFGPTRLSAEDQQHFNDIMKAQHQRQQALLEQLHALTDQNDTLNTEDENESDPLTESRSTIRTKIKPLPSECTLMGTVDPHISNRDDIIDLIQKVLIQFKKPNVILTGAPGVGKTAIIEKLAYLIQQETCNDLLKGYEIIMLNVGSLLADTQYRGQMEQKVEKILRLTKERKIILFIDEFHTTINLGKASENASPGLHDLLKPYLANGSIKVIGATTEKEYDKFIKADEAFTRRFRKIIVKEPTLNETYSILKNSLEPYTTHYSIAVTDIILKRVVLSSPKVRGHNPDKALTILEIALSNAKFGNKDTLTEEDITYAIHNF